MLKRNGNLVQIWNQAAWHPAVNRLQRGMLVLTEVPFDKSQVAVWLFAICGFHPYSNDRA